MHASAQRSDKTATSSVDPVRQGARSAARNPPGKPMPTIAPPANLIALQRKIQDHAAAAHTKAEPRTDGLPSTLKAGIEGLSGINMDDVRVHYDSDKPLQMHAHAFTQGVDIHVAPGQEEHLPHEAWHAVQQKQRRVPVTMQMKGVGLNEDNALEQEADEMGKKAAQGGASIASAQNADRNAHESKASATAPVVQRLSWKGVAKGVGKVLGNVTLGPLWDAGKAIKRRYQGGNLAFGSGEYRRYLRRHPDKNNKKAAEYQTDEQLRAAYGGAPALARSINVLSAIAGDTAKYAGWATGISGLIMVATGGTAAPALAPVATMTGSIAALALTAKLALTACNQAYLANRIDNADTKTTDIHPALRQEERHARSDYGQTMVASGAFAGLGISAEAASGASIPQAWLEVTGQTEAESSLPEIAAATSGEIALTATDTATEEVDKTFVHEFGPKQKPKKSWGLQWLNPVYLLVRGLKFLGNGLAAIWNSFRADGSHKETKPGAKFKVGDNIGGEGYAHVGVRAMGNLAKHALGTVLGGVGGAVGAVVGAVGGLVGGAGAGMMKGWNKSGLGGAVLGLFGGGLGGLGAGLVAGTALGASAGWDAGHLRDPNIMGKIDTGVAKINDVAETASNAWGVLVAALPRAQDPAPQNP